MASSNAVWGIDLGQCALKAMRCTLGDDGQSIQVDAFDYIEYPKILTEPDANPEQLVRDALKQFLANNSVRDTKVAISVPGQSGLTRFIKLPPVEAKKIPDIVKYEAKQQIPFSLEDVIWDYQPLIGGVQDEGVALETEVGLFAMKRDQVFRALRPFRDAGIELDVVQLTPIAIYNATVHGVMETIPNAADYDPDNPPPSIAVISMGTDTTDLVVTNGYRVWQRSIPIGGSHFTKQLTKEMKLTFAKAEHLKRNARQAEDPKAIFQAMRPVFNDFVADIQRSLGFYRSIDRRAKITEAVALGNAMLLPGLQTYVEKNLELPVRKISEFRRLSGPSVLGTPKFKDNVLSFGVCYGLCLQALGKSRLSTNLIPRELLTARLIRRKKPWALMGLTLFLLGVMFNYLFHWNRWKATLTERFQAEAAQVSSVSSQSSQLRAKDTDLLTEFATIKARGDEVVGGADARFLVLELFKAINGTLPLPAGDGADPKAASKIPYSQRTELYIESIDSKFFENLADYVTPAVTQNHEEFLKELATTKSQLALIAAGKAPTATESGEAAAEGAAPAAEATAEAPAAEAAAPADAAATPPAPTISLDQKPGWVIQIKGFHFYNGGQFRQEKEYVQLTLLDALENGTVELPAGPGKPLEKFTMKELGIFYPLIVKGTSDVPVRAPDLNYDPSKPGTVATPAPREGGLGEEVNFPLESIPSYDFTVQFVWVPTRASQRIEKRRASQQQEQSEKTETTVAAGS